MRDAVRVFLILFVASSPALAQEPAGGQMPAGHVHEMPAASGIPLGLSHTRDGSGTSWLPDASPMMGAMHERGPWTLMLHGNAFVQWIDAGSDRGDRQFGSINWVMGTAQRNVGGGPLAWRAMFSLEPLTVGRCGYPTLLASGEQCHGEPLHDRQHPHDLIMELAAHYRRPLSDGLAVEIYGGLAGEPALGPTAFPHRLSAMPNPIAPVAHHWLDSSHITFGVVTGGVYGRAWKAETSLFNGREPDDERYGLEMGAWDSYSGRLWLMPSSRLSIQISAGHLEEAEGHDNGTREDVDRITASLTYHAIAGERVTATTVAWGQNREAHHVTSAFLVEAAIDLTGADVVYARGEVIQKTAAELSLPIDDEDPFTVSKFQIGYTRWLGEKGPVKAGVGGNAGVSIVPNEIESFYGGRAAAEGAVYVTVRLQ